MKYIGILYFLLMFNLSSYSDQFVVENKKRVERYEQEIKDYHQGRYLNFVRNHSHDEEIKASAYKRNLLMEQNKPVIEIELSTAKRTQKQINSLFFLTYLFFVLSIVLLKYVKFNYLYESYQLFVFSIGVIFLILLQDVIIEKYFLTTLDNPLDDEIRRTNIALQFLAIIPLYLSKHFSDKYNKVNAGVEIWSSILKIFFILYLIFLLTFGLLQIIFLGPSNLSFS